MYKENLHEPFSMSFVSLDICPKLEHKHNFFELVYIISGTGIQNINGSTFRYKPGHMFLLTPDDSHAFDIEETTDFFFLQFNDIYIKNKALLADNIQRLEYILHNANHKPGCILRSPSDKAFVKHMVDAIFREYENKDVYNKELSLQLINSLIIIIARNIAKFLPSKMDVTTEEKALDILNYIQANIYNPEKLKASHISEIFNISSAYLGKYFKQHANETMQKYITDYKGKLIEHRLRFSNKRINEIANEFGFSDESHLNKYFTRQYGKSPKYYRATTRKPLAI